jgi:hypothetical protein
VKKYRITILLFSLLITSVIPAAVPIENLVDVPIGVKLDGTDPSLSEVKFAIIFGCRVEGWTPIMKDENTILASILVRGKHYVEV